MAASKPAKSSGGGKPAPSKEVVKVGPQEVWGDKNRPKRTEDGKKPTTARALVLRNGKYGARGTGEVILLNKMSGREKLDLLAEDLMAQAKTALAAPFRLEKCLKIAESQYYANMDEINDLQDPDLFYQKVKDEVNARRPPATMNGADPFKNATEVALIVASKIHNAYMLASAWKIVWKTLKELSNSGLNDDNVRQRLKSDGGLRAKYLVLYDTVNILADASQSKFALLATTAPHFAPYFKKVQDDELDEPEYLFDWAALKQVHKSFLDSIIIELCLPNSNFPRPILYRILHEAIDESPREGKHFPQALWDAVGDLAVNVELQEIIESALLGPDAEKWKQEARQMPDEYEHWVDAQIFSGKASKEVANWKDVIYPLEKTKDKKVLDNMWRLLNLNYERVAGRNIDSLWRLEEVRQRTPAWHAAKGGNGADDSDDEPAGPTKKRKPGKSPLAIAYNNNDGAESDDSMPSLQTVSDSSDADSEDDDDDVFDMDDESDESDSEYDTDDEDQLRDMYREAMDAAAATAGFYDPRADAKDFEQLAEERKGNPFIKLLGALRGRMFSADPALKTTRRSEPRRGTTGAAKSAGKGKATPAKAGVVDVEDEEDAASAARAAEFGGAESEAAKKKKKKGKKSHNNRKKNKGTAAADAAASPISEPQSPPTPALATPVSPGAKKEPPRKPAQPARAPSLASGTSNTLYGSTTSLPLPTERTAQSAHKYLHEEGLMNAAKQKTKSRPDYGNLVPNAVPEKKGFLSKLGGKGKDKDKDAGKDGEGDKKSFFSNLTKKTKTYMHQLLNTAEDEKKGIAPMKWENFLRVMREMGFSYDPSTAGSSVRFDPPDPRDKPITFHKPHPDPTLYPYKLKEFSRRLKRYYGWSEADFYAAAG
ncbi:hypothetical protein K474DRAFT_1665173 [Panus rudis PR-1116 ss-1]|nr:hypothetical protein K474DRAFT_1665173 [Panus rudis PR-1116 ss-1]